MRRCLTFVAIALLLIPLLPVAAAAPRAAAPSKPDGEQTIAAGATRELVFNFKNEGSDATSWSHITLSYDDLAIVDAQWPSGWTVQQYNKGATVGGCDGKNHEVRYPVLEASGTFPAGATKSLRLTVRAPSDGDTSANVKVRLTLLERNDWSGPFSRWPTTGGVTDQQACRVWKVGFEVTQPASSPPPPPPPSQPPAPQGVTLPSRELTMQPGETRTIEFSVANQGGPGSSLSHASASWSGVELVAATAPSGWMRATFQPGQQLARCDEGTVAATQPLDEVSGTWGTGETKTFRYEVRAPPSGTEGWLAFRVTLMEGSSWESGKHRWPTSSQTTDRDQQGCRVILVKLNAPKVPRAAVLDVRFEPSHARAGEVTRAFVKLTDEASGAPVSGKAIRFQDADTGASYGLVNTDVNGIARSDTVPIRRDLRVQANFAGDSDVKPISRTLSPVVIPPDAGALSFSFDPGTPRHGDRFSAVVRLTNDSGVPQAQRTIQLFDADTSRLLGRATTNADGEARLDGLVPPQASKQRILATFAGDGHVRSLERVETVTFQVPPTQPTQPSQPSEPAVTPLRIDGFSPREGRPGDEISVVGSGFARVTQVLVAGRAATFQATDDSRLRLTVPEGVSTGRIVVRAADGQAPSRDELQIRAITLPDLVPLLQLDKTRTTPGTTVFASVGVENRGSQSDREFKVQVRVDGRVVDTLRHHELPKTIAQTFSTLGEHRYEVRVDVDDDVRESDESNNLATAGLQIEGRAPSTIGASTAPPPSWSAGQPGYFLIHGVCSSAELWTSPQGNGNKIYEALRQRGPVWTGTIDETIHTTPDAMEQQLKTDLRAFQQQWGLQRVVLVGHSLGGLLAREIAAEPPMPIERVVTLDAPDKPRTIVADFLSELACDGGWPTFIDHHLDDHEGDFSWFDDARAATQSSSNVIRAIYADCRLEDVEECEGKDHNVIVPFDAAEWTGSVLLFYGSSGDFGRAALCSVATRGWTASTPEVTDPNEGLEVYHQSGTRVHAKHVIELALHGTAYAGLTSCQAARPAALADPSSGASQRVSLGAPASLKLFCATPHSKADLRSHWRLSPALTDANPERNPLFDIKGAVGTDAETFRISRAGTYSVEAWCSQDAGKGWSQAETNRVTWTIEVASSAPRAKAAKPEVARPVKATVGQEKAFVVSCLDRDDGDMVRAAWRVLRQGSEVDASSTPRNRAKEESAKFELERSFADPGNYVVEARCLDASGAESNIVLWSVEVAAAQTTATLVVKTNVRGGLVTLDGELVGTTDRSGKLTIHGVDQGRHRIKVSLDGYQTHETEADIHGTQEVAMKLRKVRA